MVSIADRRADRHTAARQPMFLSGHSDTGHPLGSLDRQTGHPLGSVLYIYFYYYTKQTGWVSCPMSTVYPCPPLSTPVQCPPYTDCPPCLDSPSVHLDSDVHVSTLSTWGVLSTLGAEPLPNRGIPFQALGRSQSRCPTGGSCTLPAYGGCIQNRASSSGGGGGLGGRPICAIAP